MPVGKGRGWVKKKPGMGQKKVKVQYVKILAQITCLKTENYGLILCFIYVDLWNLNLLCVKRVW